MKPWSCAGSVACPGFTPLLRDPDQTQTRPKPKICNWDDSTLRLLRTLISSLQLLGFDSQILG